MRDFFDRLAEPIKTKRLILRAPMLDDVDILCELANNVKIYEMLARLPHPYKEEHAIEFINEIARTNNEHAYAITKKDGNLIGVMSFAKFLDKKIELGYWLGEPYWGKGYASEAALGIINVAKATGICPPIVSRAISANKASINVLKKCSFTIVDERIDDCGHHKGVSVTYLELNSELV